MKSSGFGLLGSVGLRRRMAKKRAKPKVEAIPKEARLQYVFMTLRGLLGLWVVLLVLALCPYTSDPAGPIKDLISTIAVSLIAIVWLLGVVFQKHALRFRTTTVCLLAAFLLVNFAAALLSDYPPHSLNTLRLWVPLALAAVFAAQVYERPEQVWRLIAVTVGAVAVSSLYGFSQRMGFDPFPWSQTEIEEYHGLPSTYANPNFAGHALVLAFFMACGLVWKGSKKRPLPFRIFALASASLIGAHLYLTHMRGGRVALIATGLLLGVFVLIRSRTRSPLRAALVSGLVLAALGAVAGMGMFAIAQDPSDDDLLPIDGSLVLRLNGYYGASRMVLEHPVLGIGPGNYALENIPYWTAYEKQWFATAGKKNTHVHSDPLEAAIDAGLPGAAAYVALLLWAVLTSLTLAASKTDPERRRVGLVLAACFTAFAIDGLFGFNLRVPVSAGFFFLLLGVLDAPACAQPAAGPDEGAASGSNTHRASIALSLLLAALAVLCAYFATRAFIGERLYQRALGAKYWAGEFRKQDKPAAEARALSEGYASLERGRAYLPWDSRFPESQGQIDLILHRPDLAVARFSEALALFPHHPGVMISLAQAHINRAVTGMSQIDAGALNETAAFEQDLEKAEDYAERAAELCEVHPEAHEALGRVAFLHAVAREQVGKDASAYWSGAITALRRALRYGAPKRATLQRMLGEAHVHIHQIEQAEEALERAAESDPSDDETWALFHSLAKEHGHRQVFIDALNHNLGRVKRQSPVPAGVVATIALHLADMYAAEEQDPVLAREVLRDALDLDPKRLDLWGFLITLLPPAERLPALQAEWRPLAEASEKEGASLPAVFPVMARVDPADPEALLGASRVLEKATQARGKNGSAQQVSRELSWLADVLQDQMAALPTAPATQGQLLARLGSVYTAAGRWRTADRALERAIPLLSPKEKTAALLHRSQALGELGQGEDALRLAREAARLAPNDANVRWNLARRLVAAGHYAEAKFEYVALVKQLGRKSPALPEIDTEYRALERAMARRQAKGDAS